jgi:hypothetical protein
MTHTEKYNQYVQEWIKENPAFSAPYEPMLDFDEWFEKEYPSVFYGTNKKFIEASELYHPIDKNLNYSKELLTDKKFRRSYFIEGCEYQQQEQDDFAIEFAEWCLDNNQIIQNDGKELLKIFKKEKGL